MKVSNFMARQYANPSGLFGRMVIAPLLNKANKLANDLVYQFLDVRSDSTVLEVGFGGGDLLLRILRDTKCESVTGLEKSREMVERLHNKISLGAHTNRIKLLSGSIETLPFSPGQFNRICSVNTIYFWTDLQQCFAQLSKIMQLGGYLVLGFSSGEALKQKGYQERGFIFHSPDQVRDALIHSNFIVVKEHQVERGSRGPFFIIKCQRSIHTE